ncbi:Transmembrane emp24 domain-containing protein B [Diplonema papillatum]|nr:Transmembrane emp24 domain-containing protein B [Diplonema papillatum]
MSPLVAALSFFALLPCAFGTQGGGLVFPMELGEVRCFYQEAVEENSKVFVHVTSLDGGNDMHVLISGPVQLDTDMEPSLGSGDIVFEGDLNKDQEFGETKILFRAQTAGFYQVCIGNKRQLAKLAGVNIMAEDPTEQKVGPFRPMAPIKKTIIKISETLHSIKEEQAYLKTRERVHRETAESTYQRVMMWSSLAIVLLISMGVGQIRYFYGLFGSSSTRSRGV